ncbi:MAG TPA: DUF3873 family protein [Bacteroidales bacterium]|nr:DUF3873 family protein [Bacteroidales bacterium]
MTEMTKNGVSTTVNHGQEQFETFHFKNKSVVQYDYRHTDGQLFSCCMNDLKSCRQKRDKWLKDKIAGL